MKHFLCILILQVLGFSQLYAQADDARLAEIKKAAAKVDTAKHWTRGGGIGLDLSQLALINPRVGSGENRLGLGGIGTVFANYKKNRIAWDNVGSLQIAVQKLGEDDFQKNLDLVRVGSKVGYALKNPKWLIGAEATLQTQFLQTYPDNFLTPQFDSLQSISKFFSPALITFAPGIDWKPNEHVSVFFAPIASQRFLIVADDRIASLNLHGNPWSSPTDYKKLRYQLGGSIKGTYNNKYFKDRMTVYSALTLFSDYLDHPENIAVLWQNNYGLLIFKNFSINLLVDAVYDDKIPVQVDRNDNGIYEEGELGKRISLSEALVIKYNYIF